MSASGLAARLRPAASALLAARQAQRRRSFLVRTRLTALAVGARLDLQVAPDARIGSRVRVELARGTGNRLVLGPRTRIRDDVVIQLSGGEVHLGPDCDVRQRCVLNVAGVLRLHGRNILSVGTTVHCGLRMDWMEMASCSEYVTVVDSRHYHTDPDTWFYDNSESAPVRIGRNAWMAAKATVLMGSDIGDGCVIGAGSVVRGEVPAGMVAAGIPARPLRPSMPAPEGAGGRLPNS